MTERCWICFEQTNDTAKCDCKNGFQYAHYNCLYKLNKSHCRFCKKKYKCYFL